MRQILDEHRQSMMVGVINAWKEREPIKQRKMVEWASGVGRRNWEAWEIETCKYERGKSY